MRWSHFTLTQTWDYCKKHSECLSRSRLFCCYGWKVVKQSHRPLHNRYNLENKNTCESIKHLVVHQQHTDRKSNTHHWKYKKTWPTYRDKKHYISVPSTLTSKITFLPLVSSICDTYWSANMFFLLGNGQQQVGCIANIIWYNGV